MDSIEYFFSSSEDEECQQVVRKQLRDVSNPLSLPELRFKELFRLNKHAFLDLLQDIENEFKPSARSSSLSPLLKLSAVLRFFGEGSFQRGTGQDYLISMAQSTVSVVLSEVLNIMERKVCPKWISIRRSDAEKETCKREFYEKTSFPGVIGCVDGTHINIRRPNNDEHLFINRKGTHSVNAMLVCDHKIRILAIDARYGGSTHDSFVWGISDVRTHLSEERERGESNCWLLGDSGYPLEPWLITPYRVAVDGSREANFNSKHSETRVIVERTIGVLKSRFRCLYRRLLYEPKKMVQIINACASLHNICINYNIDIRVDSVSSSSDDISIIEPAQLDTPENQIAQIIRNNIKDSL